MKKLKTLLAALAITAMIGSVPVLAQDSSYQSSTSTTTHSVAAADQPSNGMSTYGWIAVGVGALVVIGGVIAAMNMRKKDTVTSQGTTVNRTTTTTTSRDNRP